MVQYLQYLLFLILLVLLHRIGNQQLYAGNKIEHLHNTNIPKILPDSAPPIFHISQISLNFFHKFQTLLLYTGIIIFILIFDIFLFMQLFELFYTLLVVFLGENVYEGQDWGEFKEGYVERLDFFVQEAVEFVVQLSAD